MALQPCEALKKIREALGVGAVTPEALAVRIMRAHEKHVKDGWVTGMPPTPEMITVAAEILKQDAGAEIRAILDEVNDSLPAIYRK